MDISEPSSPILGAGAPHDQNWNPAKSNTRPATQASLLPPFKSVRLNKINPPLDSSEGFGRWYQAVLSALEDHNLQDLIKIEVPRPHRDDANAERWYRLSQQVTTFLTQSVDGSLAKRILETQTHCVFADEFVTALKN